MKKVIGHLRALSVDLLWAARYAADIPSFYRLTSDFLSHRLIHLTRRPLSNHARRVRLRGGTKLNYRSNLADIWVIHEVWVEKIYTLTPGIETNVVVDLGANIGLTSLWLATNYNCERIMAVEPNGDNVKVARRNLDGNRIVSEVFEAAAGGEDGTAVFDIGPGATNGRVVKSGGFSSNASQNRSGQYEVKVLGMNSILHSLPPETPIDLLKIDIEGGEQNLFSGDLSWLSRVQAIVAEFHPQLIDYPALVQKLEEAGFHRTRKESIDGDSLEVFVR